MLEIALLYLPFLHGETGLMDSSLCIFLIACLPVSDGVEDDEENDDVDGDDDDNDCDDDDIDDAVVDCDDDDDNNSASDNFIETVERVAFISSFAINSLAFGINCCSVGFVRFWMKSTGSGCGGSFSFFVKSFPHTCVEYFSNHALSIFLHHRQRYRDGVLRELDL